MTDLDRKDSLPIAVFDSGVGGLTVLHECLVSLPEEDYVYLGDDARFPYGAKSDADLRECVVRNTSFLLERGTKLLVIACNSAASAGLETARELAAAQGVDVVAVIEPEAEIAAAITDSGRVGVLATPATVAGGSYLRALGRQRRELTVTQVAAPDLAAIIQRGFPFSVRAAAISASGSITATTSMPSSAAISRATSCPADAAELHAITSSFAPRSSR